MKKILWLMLLLIPLNVFAASGSIKATTSSTKVTLNNTFTVKVTCSISGASAIGTCDFNLDYDKSKLSITSGKDNLTVRDWSRDGKGTTMTYTYKFKAIATGSASIKLTNAKVGDYDTDKYVDTSVSNLTITIKEPVIINYSSDNNLKSLKVDGFELTPEFNKSTLEYTATLDSHTTKVKISAEVNDSKAKLTGTGEKEVKEGSNPFEIVVTAENGSTKTYKLNLVVPEKDPVKYTFGDTEYYVLRKLPEERPNNFNTSTIKFNDEEVACLQNEKLNLTLIYLRDSNNKENFYIYDLTNKTITLYNEVSSNDLSIYIVDTIKELSKLEKTTIEINDQVVNAYQIRKGSNHYIIYGKDISTGKGNYYVYDSTLKTLSSYNEEDLNYLRESNSIYKILTYALGALVLALLLIVVLNANTKKKMNIMINKLTEERTLLESKKKSKKKE